MKVCFFGSYVLDAYTPLLKKILKLQGIEVIECHEEISKVSSFIPAYFRLFLKHRKLKYDVMIIPWQGIITLPLAKLISKKPIVYYAAISVYDTLVIDRRIIKPNSIKAKFTHVIDKLACQWSDMVYTESFEYIKYFVNEFGLDKNKFRRLFLSADETIYQSIPYKEPTQEFKVLYFGTFIPLHGTDTIVEAAKILSKYKDIVFIFSGTGQEKTLVENLAKKYHLSNVKFLGFVEKSIYLKNITEADVCLGIFGKSRKAKNVVTNKVTQILASQKPLITMDSEAIREITAENEKNCILVPPNDPKKLADAILFLKNNPHKRESIAKAGRELYVKNLSLEKTGKLLVSYLMELVNEKRLSLYSLTTSYVKSSKRGVGSFIHDLNKELISLGVRVKVITPHSKGEKFKEVVDGIKIIRFKYSPENFEINFSAISDEVSKSRKGLFKVFLMTGGFFLNSFLECLKEKPDILHAHWAFPAGYVAYILSRIFRKKIVITIHGGELPLLKKFNFLRQVVINGLNNSSIVIANSNYTKKELISMGVKERKIIIEKVIPNFLKHSENKKSLAEFRRKVTKPDNQIILFFGRLVERKGVEYLIQALNEMETKNVHLIIAGGGELFEKLRILTKQLHLESKVTFFGRATDQELASLQEISDIFVCPSIVDSRGMTEYLGLVIPEAMKAGLPVIATSVGGIVDTVKNEVNGLLVEQKNPKAISKAIERIFSDDILKKKIIENSKETVKEFYPQTIAQRHFDIFQNLISN